MVATHIVRSWSTEDARRKTPGSVHCELFVTRVEEGVQPPPPAGPVWEKVRMRKEAHIQRSNAHLHCRWDLSVPREIDAVASCCRSCLDCRGWEAFGWSLQDYSGGRWPDSHRHCHHYRAGSIRDRPVLLMITAFHHHTDTMHSITSDHKWLSVTVLNGRTVVDIVVMATRLSLEQRSEVAAWIEVFQSPTVVRIKYQAYFNCDPPFRLTNYHIYDKFVTTSSVANYYRGNGGRSRTGRSLANITVAQEVFLRSPGKSISRYSTEYGIPQTTVWRILNKDLGMRPHHLQAVKVLSPADKVAQATFHVNKHNCVLWGSENPSVVEEHERSSLKINVWCAVTATRVVVPYFFKNDTVTGADILLMMETYVADNLPLRILLTGYFQLDGALPHFARMRAHGEVIDRQCVHKGRDEGEASAAGGVKQCITTGRCLCIITPPLQFELPTTPGWQLSPMHDVIRPTPKRVELASPSPFGTPQN
ncbi:hypothetical protein PR048_003649 [Dryococelus australis]|uniref:HTH psq-type domain-containing protein n=1 Tax=Dryococelus australis TaxID=614101 RepID=A0ABQ9INP8_9NEOP|nr:hypothetical protein PR048_003649 [Dryococelus australis]